MLFIFCCIVATFFYLFLLLLLNYATVATQQCSYPSSSSMHLWFKKGKKNYSYMKQSCSLVSHLCMLLLKTCQKRKNRAPRGNANLIKASYAFVLPMSALCKPFTLVMSSTKQNTQDLPIADPGLINKVILKCSTHLDRR